MLSFEVRDEESSMSRAMLLKSKFIAGASLPVTCMRQGIRSCALSDEYANGNQISDFIFPSLLLYIQIRNNNE